MKLQDAYVSEKGTSVGSWKQIGYLMNNTSNFYYCGASSCAAGTNTDGYGGQADITTDSFTGGLWTAHNIATLNDCAAGDNWTLTTSANSTTGGSVLYTATVSNSGTTLCETLTPSFKKLHTASTTTTDGND